MGRYAVIASSTRRENLASNLLAADLKLDADDMAKIATLDRNSREANPKSSRPYGTILAKKLA